MQAHAHKPLSPISGIHYSLLPILELILTCFSTSVLESSSRPLVVERKQFLWQNLSHEVCSNQCFLSPQTTLLYCPSSIDLQTLAEWNSSPISHQFDVISPSHIWIFAHVTQGQDPWIISLSSFLKQENLPKHCSTAVSYAWMFAYTRLQLLSPQVDLK